MLRRTCVLVAAALLVVAGCSAERGLTDEDPSPVPTADGPPSPEPSEPDPEPTEAPDPVPYVECAPGEGRTVTELGLIEIDAVEIPEVRGEALEVAGETVPGATVEGAVVPARVVDAGCVVEYDAPGGCLGAVEISPVVIPEVTIPQRVIPSVELPDGTVLEEVVLPAVTQAEVRVEGARVEQVCQVTVERGSYEITPTVVRPTVVRPTATQPTLTQPFATRPITTVAGVMVPGMVADGAVVDGVVVDGVVVDGEDIPGYFLETAPDVQVLPGEDETSYVSEGDVLFDVDQDTIRPDAEAGLRAIAQDIADNGLGGPVRVEGHTDDVGGEQYNADLSVRRADSVAAWLIEVAGIDAARITTEGYGYSVPRDTNATEEGRQQNRRVVITVSSG